MKVDKNKILKDLKSYRNNMSEFYEEEMDYLISLVERDLNTKLSDFEYQSYINPIPYTEKV